MAIPVSSIALTAAVFLSLTQSSSADIGDNCLSPATRFDACKKAKELQAQIAPTLPQRINQELIMDGVFAAGPTLRMTAIWDMTKIEFDSRLVLNNSNLQSLRKLLDDNTKRTVCGGGPLIAFVRLGGRIQYVYKTRDGFIIHSPIVSRCPQISF